MEEIVIHNKISYIPASDDPLSADIGIIREDGDTWLFDVGNAEAAVSGLNGEYHVVLSHFHQDHIGNLQRLSVRQLYVSKETYAHTHWGTIVREDITIGKLHIFPLPSSHAKGCLGLEIDGMYAFVGDAIYCRNQDGRYCYNAQLLKDEIAVLRRLRAPFLLVSHFDGLIRKREDVLAELEMIYSMRVPNDPIIPVK